MKRYIKFTIIIAIIGIIIAACMKIVEFIHPESADVNTEVEASIKVKIDVNNDIDKRTTFLMGMLAPVSWNISENATITYSSPNMPGEGAVNNLKMRVATPSDLFKGKEWKVIMTEKLGSRNNFEPVEWVAFIAEQDHNWVGGDSFEGTINIKFKTGAENLKTNLSYFIGNATDGVHDDPDYYLIKDQLFETFNGDNPTIDYTMPKMCYMSPEKYTWEDIVKFNFDATVQVEGEDSLLKDEEEVYFIARATYNNEADNIVIDEISPKTLMKKNANNKWFLYMYPHEYFSIPTGVKIEKIEFYFVDKNRTKKVAMPNGEAFTFYENCQ